LLGELTHSLRDFGKQISGLEFEIIFVQESHATRKLGGRPRLCKQGRKLLQCTNAGQ
jgi:hypothetical protein